MLSCNAISNGKYLNETTKTSHNGFEKFKTCQESNENAEITNYTITYQ